MLLSYLFRFGKALCKILCNIINFHDPFQVAYRAGYININWKRMEKDMDKITKKVEKQVKKIRKNDDVEKGVIALANRVSITDNKTIENVTFSCC